MNASQLPALNIQITRSRGSDADHDRIVLGGQGLDVDVASDFLPGDEADTLRSHQVDPALDDRLVEFHVWNTIHQQAADPVRTLENRHGMAGVIELIGAGQAGWSGSNHGDVLASPGQRRLRNHPAV